MIIRKAAAADSDKILEIYKPYILKTVITFEYTVPSPQVFKNRVEKIISEYPYIVCEDKGEILGYCYGSRLMERAAFGWDMELSVYLKEEYRGKGIGGALYGAVMETAELMNIKNLYGLIAAPNTESERLHARFGFTHEATLKKTGYKFGRWIDLMCFRKEINQNTEVLPVKNANDLNPVKTEKILKKYEDYLNGISVSKQS